MPGEIFVITAPSGHGKDHPAEKPDGRGSPAALLHFLHHPAAPLRGGPRPGLFFCHPGGVRGGSGTRAPWPEWVEQFGYGYGTSREWVADMVERGRRWSSTWIPGAPGPSKRNFPRATLIFILPPSLAALERRLRAGEDGPRELARRLAQGRAELRKPTGMTTW